MPQARIRTKPTKDQRLAGMKPSISERQIPIDWKVPPSITTRLATHFIVQTTPQGEVILSFFEIIPPIIMGTPAEQDAQLTKIKVIEAECVGRINITPARLAEFIEILHTHLQALTETDDTEDTPPPKTEEE